MIHSADISALVNMLQHCSAVWQRARRGVSPRMCEKALISELCPPASDADEDAACLTLSSPSAVDWVRSFRDKTCYMLLAVADGCA